MTRHARVSPITIIMIGIICSLSCFAHFLLQFVPQVKEIYIRHPGLDLGSPCYRHYWGIAGQARNDEMRLNSNHFLFLYHLFYHIYLLDANVRDYRIEGGLCDYYKMNVIITVVLIISGAVNLFSLSRRFEYTMIQKINICLIIIKW